MAERRPHESGSRAVSDAKTADLCCYCGDACLDSSRFALNSSAFSTRRGRQMEMDVDVTRAVDLFAAVQNGDVDRVGMLLPPYEALARLCESGLAFRRGTPPGAVYSFNRLRKNPRTIAIC